jgi:hypothetical protein
VRKVLFILLSALFVLQTAATILVGYKMYRRDRRLAEFVHATLQDNENLPTEEKVLRLSDAIYRRTRYVFDEDKLDWYSRLECKTALNVTASVSLRYGGFGLAGHSTVGPCGTMTRTLLNVLWSLDISARKLQILDNAEGKGGGHTMIEFQADGKWLVISPADSSFVWRKADGSIAGAEEIRRDPKLFSQIYERYPKYPYLFDRYGNIRWEKLPPRLQSLARRVLGEERYRTATTPRLYDRPRTLIFLASLCMTLLFGLLACAARPRRRSRPAAE